MSTTALRDHIVAELDAARMREDRLLELVDDRDLARQVSPLMSPLCWDMAHIAHYEELWLLRALGADAASDQRLDDVYDAFAHARAERGELDILDPTAARRFAGDVRKRALDVLTTLPTGALDADAGEPLLRNGFVYGMVLQHAHQHLETMLATLSLMGVATRGAAVANAGFTVTDEVLVGGGEVELGTDDEPWAYDNERPAHRVEMAPYLVDTTPVTNEAYAEFVAAGGYDDARWWTEDGWAWRIEAELEHPQFWLLDGDRWHRRRFAAVEQLPPHEPVQHVCWYEADAYARWRGKRLPTEAEWERAATGGMPRRFPWGGDTPTDAHAALATGDEHLAPGPVAAHPSGASPRGVHDAIGGVWEWTATDFRGYPGFRAFPYREYSEVFFGDGYKVLRGGSWATHPSAARTTFRNWDLPVRRQIFAGFRCARDVPDVSSRVSGDPD